MKTIVCAIFVSIYSLVSFAGEPVIVELRKTDDRTDIAVNGSLKNLAEAKAVFLDLRKQFGSDLFIDVRSEKTVPVGDLFQFMESIDGFTWKNLQIRVVPGNTLAWPEFIRALYNSPALTSDPRTAESLLQRTN